MGKDVDDLQDESQSQTGGWSALLAIDPADKGALEKFADQFFRFEELEAAFEELPEELAETKQGYKTLQEEVVKAATTMVDMMCSTFTPPNSRLQR